MSSVSISYKEKKDGMILVEKVSNVLVVIVWLVV